MEAKEESARYKTYFDYWFDKMNDYLQTAKEEAFDYSARYEDARFFRDRARYFPTNNRDYDVQQLVKAASNLMILKLEAETNVEWAETKIAAFMLLSESQPEVIHTIYSFIERNGIREKLGKAKNQDEFYAMLRAFNRNMAL